MQGAVLTAEILLFIPQPPSRSLSTPSLLSHLRMQASFHSFQPSVVSLRRRGEECMGECDGMGGVAGWRCWLDWASRRRLGLGWDGGWVGDGVVGWVSEVCGGRGRMISKASRQPDGIFLRSRIADIARTAEAPRKPPASHIRPRSQLDFTAHRPELLLVPIPREEFPPRRGLGESPGPHGAAPLAMR